MSVLAWKLSSCASTAGSGALLSEEQAVAPAAAMIKIEWYICFACMMLRNEVDLGIRSLSVVFPLGESERVAPFAPEGATLFIKKCDRRIQLISWLEYQGLKR